MIPRFNTQLEVVGLKPGLIDSKIRVLKEIQMDSNILENF